MLLGPGAMQEDPNGLAAIGRDLTRPCQPYHSPEKIKAIVDKVLGAQLYDIKYEQSLSQR